MGFFFQNRVGQNVNRRGPADQGGRRTSVNCGLIRRPGHHAKQVSRPPQAAALSGIQQSRPLAGFVKREPRALPGEHYVF